MILSYFKYFHDFMTEKKIDFLFFRGIYLMISKARFREQRKKIELQIGLERQTKNELKNEKKSEISSREIVMFVRRNRNGVEKT